jgi:2-polyprenyl-3-methyl-5-hydroxy-6-metoxy-1,4-benzoquinol methylase
LNRTMLSYALGIVVAEQVLGWAPPGTHHHEKFVRRSSLNRLQHSRTL